MIDVKVLICNGTFFTRKMAVNDGWFYKGEVSNQEILSRKGNKLFEHIIISRSTCRNSEQFLTEF